MAKFVIAGSSDCPHYARIELLADNLAKNLPSFNLTKIVKTPEEWQEWSHQFCEEKGWHRYTSPIVWRELVNQGGKGVLIGGANEFQEYVKAYYDLESDLLSPQQLAVARDNARFKSEIDAELNRLRANSKPLRIVVTAACGPTAYHLMPLLADGSVFGRETELAITLFDLSDSEAIEGLAMEVEDLAQPLLRSVRCTRSLSNALTDPNDGLCPELLVLLDELPLSVSTDNQEKARSDWLTANARLYKNYAAAVEGAGCGGPSGIRILVAGRGPVNLGARILLDGAHSRRGPHPDRVAATPRLLERQAKGAVAARIGVNPSGVGNLVVWGDPAGGHIAELGRATVTGYEEGSITGPDGYRRPLLEVLWDQEWLQADLPRLLSRRQADSIRCRGGQFAASSARAVADTLRDWWLGHRDQGITSLGVMSKGWYGIPEGIVFSFPVRFQPKGTWSVVEDFDLSAETLQKLQSMAEESQRDYNLTKP